MENMGRCFLCLLLAAAACIALFARFYNFFPGDQPLLEWFQTWRNPAVTGYMEAVSFIGRSWLIVGLAGLVVLGLFAAGRRREGFAATGIVAILLLSPLMKLIVDRPRPPLDLAGTANPLGDLSFPSGHAFQSLVLFAFLIFLAAILVRTPWIRWSTQVFLVVLILAIGASRVYLNAHWPSDIVGAYIIGGFFLAVLFRCYRRADPVAAMDSGGLAMPVTVSEIRRPA
jgi:undecaprenyl-diphosphatase